MSHAEWLERKERDLEDERYAKMLEDRKRQARENARKENSKRQFDEWLKHKESFERGVQLLFQLDEQRCVDPDQWFEVAVAVNAIDCLRGVYKKEGYEGLPCDRNPENNVSRDELRKRRTLQEEFYRWSKNAEHGHEFENVPIENALAKTFTLNAQENMSEHAEHLERDGEYIMPSLKYAAPRAKQAAHDKRNLYNPDTAKYNKIYNRLIQSEFLRAQKTMYERLDKATARQELSNLPLEAAERRVLSGMGLAKLAKWVEEDAVERDSIAENRKREERQIASQKHLKFVEHKNKLRLRLPDNSDDELQDVDDPETYAKMKRVLYGNPANKENGRMDFSRSKPKSVRGRRPSTAAANSVETATRDGLGKQKYVYALNYKDLESARSTLAKEGHLFRENFRDEDGDLLVDEFEAAKEAKPSTRKHRIRDLVKQREEKAAETYQEWATQKDLRSRALDCLQHIDKPGNIGEGTATDETHWRYVGEQLKAVDQTLLSEFINWSAGFKTAAQCKATWESLPPNVCDTCNPSSTVHNVLLKFLNRPGMNFTDIFDFAVEREVRRIMASDGRDPDEATPEEIKKIEDSLELTPRRFQQMMQDAGIPIQAHEVRILTTLFDKDGNNKISRKEFLSFTGYDPRPSARGDAVLKLRNGEFCSWESCCHVTGLTSAYEVRPAPTKQDKAGDNDEEDYSQDEAYTTDPDADELVIKDLPLLLRNGKAKQGWIRMPLPDLERRSRRLVRSGDRKPSDFRKPVPSSCELSRWTNQDRMTALDGLDTLSEANREISRTLALQTQGESPLAPIITLGPVHSLPESDRQKTLILRWNPREGSMFPTFYVLETCGREGSKTQRQHEYKELYRDPPSAASGQNQKGEFTMRKLEAGVRYYFRLRAFNGYGSSPFTYASFTTAPLAPPVPIIKSLAPTTLTLSWGGSAPETKAHLRELRDVFRGLDVTSSGEIDPEKFLDTLEQDYSHLYQALETMGAPSLPGSNIVGLIESLFNSKSQLLKWTDLKEWMRKSSHAKGGSSLPSSSLSPRSSSSFNNPKVRGITYVLCRCIADEEVDFRREGAVSSKRSEDDTIVSVLRGSSWYADKSVASFSTEEASSADAQAIAERLDIPKPYLVEMPMPSQDAQEKPALKVVIMKRRKRRQGGTPDEGDSSNSLSHIGQLLEPITHLEVFEVMYFGSEPRCVLTGLNPGGAYQFRVFAISNPPKDGADLSLSAGDVSQSTVTSRMSAALVVNMPAVAPPPPRIVNGISTDSVFLQWTKPDLDMLNRKSRAKESLNAKKDNWNRVVGEWAKDPTSESKGGVSDSTLRKTFMRYDKNADGTMDAEELAELFMDLGLRASGPSFVEALNDLDVNKDGVVSYTEFANWWQQSAMNFVLLHKEQPSQDSQIDAAKASWHVVYRGTKTEAQITGLAPNTRHIFTLQCELQRAMSSTSTEVLVFTAPETPRQPVVIEAGPRHMRVKWYPGVGGAHRYVLEAMLIERLPLDQAPATTSGTLPKSKKRGPVPASERQWVSVYEGKDTLALISDLENCAVYRLRVKALNSEKIESSPSLPAQFATTTARDKVERRSSQANAAKYFNIECTGDIVAGDTILFTERVFASPNEELGTKKGRRTSRNPVQRTMSGVSLSQQSVSSLEGGSNQGSRGVFLSERTVAARIQSTRQRKSRELIMEVLWSSMSVKSVPEKYHLKECSRITRSEHEIFKFETFRAAWAQENSRWSFQDELEAVQ